MKGAWEIATSGYRTDELEERLLDAVAQRVATKDADAHMSARSATDAGAAVGAVVALAEHLGSEYTNVTILGKPGRISVHVYAASAPPEAPEESPA